MQIKSKTTLLLMVAFLSSQQSFAQLSMTRQLISRFPISKFKTVVSTWKMMPNCLPLVEYRDEKTAGDGHSQKSHYEPFAEPLVLYSLMWPFVAKDKEVDHQKDQSQIKALTAKLQQTITNHHGQKISIFHNPSQVLEQVKNFTKFISELPDNHPYKNSLEVQEYYLKAITLLYKGRGKDMSGPGWYLANRKGPTGMAEISEILKEGKLDLNGLKQLKSFIAKYDFTQDLAKLEQGFPITFIIISEMQKNHLLKEIETINASHVHPQTYQAVAAAIATAPVATPTTSSVATSLTQLINEKVADLAERTEYKSLLAKAEFNFFDQYHKSPKGPASGREEELLKISEALSRIEKGHCLLTGKAGVGKTTLVGLLQKAYAEGTFKIRQSAVPIILELPINLITNPENPTELKSFMKSIQKMSEALDRHIILYVDEAHVASKMSKNALKSFLSQKLLKDSNRVHMIWSTTSSEARSFLDDSAFIRRWTQVHVPEFSPQQSQEIIASAFVPLWKKEHKDEFGSLQGISEEAYQFAAKHYRLEQPAAANPTGMKELLEGALIHKLHLRKKAPVEQSWSLRQLVGGKSADQIGDFTLELEDLRNYIMLKTHLELIPGDPQFAQKFKAKWEQFQEQYVGNEEFKAQLELALQEHFSSLDKKQMTSWIFFGPPGGGKSFAVEQLAKNFFAGAVLTINGAEFKNGGLELNKLLGSPTGVIGSEEQRSILTRFMAENPQGGIIKVEEADYLNADVLQLFTNMITDQKFTDGLGKEWDTSRFVLILNSNIGQELMIPKNSRHKMNWTDFHIRKQALLAPEKKDRILEKFVEKVILGQSPKGADTSLVSQEAIKQKRRFSTFYVFPPDEASLEKAAIIKVQNFVKSMQVDYGVNLVIPAEVVTQLVQLEDYDFFKGMSYLEENLESRLFAPLKKYAHLKGAEVKVKYQTKTDSGENSLLFLVNGDSEEFLLPPSSHPYASTYNPWKGNEVMEERIDQFAFLMRQTLKGNVAQIEGTKEQLKHKFLDWNQQVVISQIGTSGNGKTEFFRAMAKSLYGSEDALFIISGINHPYDLSNYLRPPTGVMGSLEETEFEQWFKSRQHAGGGIILFDEMLSVDGLNKEQMGNKLAAFDKIYDLLDSGKIAFGNKQEDARGFVIGLTGNALQEKFNGLEDTPELEQQVKKIIKKTNTSAIKEYLGSKGFDAPKVARMGRIYLNGPLSFNDSLAVGKMKVQKSVEELLHTTGPKSKMEVNIDPAIIHQVTAKLSTVHLGMREVQQGIDQVVHLPLAGILADIPGIYKVEAVLTGQAGPAGTDHIQWLVNGKKVILHGNSVDAESELLEKKWIFAPVTAKGMKAVSDYTPQLDVLPAKNILHPSDMDYKIVAIHEFYGHWMSAFLLSGKNSSEFISIIPGKGYLGYVRPKANESLQQGLTSQLKEMMILAAGQRAVFQKGIYAMGAGITIERSLQSPSEKNYPSDDLGKINKIILGLRNNHIFDEFSESSSSQDQQIFHKVFEDVAAGAADYVIQLGMSSAVFDDLFAEFVAHKFIPQERLDQFSIRGIATKKLPTPPEVFVAALASGIANAEQTQKSPLAHRLLKELQLKSLTELKQLKEME